LWWYKPAWQQGQSAQVISMYCPALFIFGVVDDQLGLEKMCRRGGVVVVVGGCLPARGFVSHTTSRPTVAGVWRANSDNDGDPCRGHAD
jgi:hypothetical protein